MKFFKYFYNVRRPIVEYVVLYGERKNISISVLGNVSEGTLEELIHGWLSSENGGSTPQSAALPRTNP